MSSLAPSPRPSCLEPNLTCRRLLSARRQMRHIKLINRYFVLNLQSGLARRDQGSRLGCRRRRRCSQGACFAPVWAMLMVGGQSWDIITCSLPIACWMRQCGQRPTGRLLDLTAKHLAGRAQVGPSFANSLAHWFVIYGQSEGAASGGFANRPARWRLNIDRAAPWGCGGRLLPPPPPPPARKASGRNVYARQLRACVLCGAPFSRSRPRSGRRRAGLARAGSSSGRPSGRFEFGALARSGRRSRRARLARLANQTAAAEFIACRLGARFSAGQTRTAAARASWPMASGRPAGQPARWAGGVWRRTRHESIGRREREKIDLPAAGWPASTQAAPA